MSKKTRNIIIFAFGISVVIYIMTANYFTSKSAKQEFSEFDNSTIDGVIKDIYTKHHGVGLKLVGDNEEFIFYPYSSDLNDGKIFHHLAKPGDRIVKSKNSDTLTLISNDEKYKYTFQRFDTE